MSEANSEHKASGGDGGTRSLMTYLISILVVVLAVVVGGIYQTPSSTPCVLVDTIPWMLSRDIANTAPLNASVAPHLTPAVNTCAVFSDDYVTARRRFRDAAAAVSATVTSLPVHDARNDAEHSDYTMDIAVIVGTVPGVVVHVSGTHGPEGYTGSAIQTAFLEALTHETVRHLCTVVLVHAFNPVGMATYRRFNEHNVDLNRNGLSKDEWHSEERHWNQANYHKFEPLFAPRRAVTWWDVRVVSWGRILYAIVSHGILYLKKAIVGGQYHSASGVFYGGTETEPSLLRLNEWMTQFWTDYTHQYKDDATTQPIVTWIDVHTGLGRMGVDTLLPSNMVVHKDIRRWFPDAAWHDSKAVSAGYEDTLGRTIDYYQTQLQLSNQHLLFAQEFGTRHAMLVAHAIILENMAFHDASLSETERLAWSKDLMGAAFYPTNRHFRSNVLKGGLRCLQQAIQRSMYLSKPLVPDDAASTE